MQEEMTAQIRGRDPGWKEVSHFSMRWRENMWKMVWREYDNQGNTDLPRGSGPYRARSSRMGDMSLLWISAAAPSLRMQWQFPDGNWIYEIGADGAPVTFDHQGETPSGRIWAFSQLKQSITLTFSSRREKYQMQMGMAGYGGYGCRGCKFEAGPVFALSGRFGTGTLQA